ncbi:MAG: DUF1002 domain-containing protein [Oscillospiraceae bacterium]|nr:DUF1002 domain-containing protein [Oscillospiraceae bacterium]
MIKVNMKIKRAVAALLCTVMCLSVSAAVYADGAEAGEARAVIGANLTEEQTAEIYNVFGIERGSVEELTVTNSEERELLSGFVDESLIGTNSISCVYVEILDEGEGLQIEKQNISWCTVSMYINARVTAGITDVRMIVAAPFEVSGTAALAGVYKAYEDITGEELDDVAKLVSTQELVITGELADVVGSYDAVEIVNELKLLLDETDDMTDEELEAAIYEIAAEYGVSLTDSQVEQLISLVREFEKLDTEELMEKVEYVQDTVKKLAEAQEKISGITETIKNVVETVTSFVNRVLSFFGLSINA